MITIGKKSRYKVHLLNDMGNSTECHYFKTPREFTDFFYSLNDNQLFKAYIGGKLHCWHKKLS